jgi:putative transposase
VSVARFIADQRTKYRVPHTITCILLGVSVSWFYKWIARAQDADGVHTDTERRRRELDAAVKEAFTAAKGLHGSPRLVADLRDLGWQVSENTVADSMRRQQLVARQIKRRRGLTKQDKKAPKFPDLVKRDFTADAPNLKWVGDIVRREALFDRAEVRDHRFSVVAAAD